MASSTFYSVGKQFGSNLATGPRRERKRTIRLSRESASNIELTPASVSLTDGDDDDVENMEGKSICMVSDGTGWTAEHSVNAALAQFEHWLVDRNCAVNTHLFSGR
ncbi:hypothetical protein HS088_TW21G00755 [Tripterygium wilfordii]|uniref:Uncharacterized protein n=1 Tax=Tripterygium wilfordii TaxID=458696 RepID=A0A7J7C434_TRIWF|nr:hypothetical protein HS088_TW21G00755 [Tripterygium wilfordii]